MSTDKFNEILKQVPLEVRIKNLLEMNDSGNWDDGLYLSDMDELTQHILKTVEKWQNDGAKMYLDYKSPEPPPNNITHLYVDSSMSTIKDENGNVSAVQPGKCRVVDRDGKVIDETIFESPHTNNFYEAYSIFLAVWYLNKNDIHDAIIYSDSQTAIAWMTKGLGKKVKQDVAELRSMIKIFQNKQKKLNFKLIKWNTAENGEIPADYGMKN